MQLVLIGVAVVSIVALQDFATGIFVLALTVFNAILGLNQEGKAAESVAALKKMLIMKAKTRRNGELVELPAEDLVPGDIVTFEAGDKVPADGRLITAATLQIEEAGLTGESAPVDKGHDADRSGGRAPGRPPRYGVYELHCYPWPRRDGRDGNGYEFRGWAHLRHAEQCRGGEDAAHAGNSINSP